LKRVEKGDSLSAGSFADHARSVLQKGSDVWYTPLPLTSTPISCFKSPRLFRYPEGSGDALDYKSGKVVAVNEDASKVMVAMLNHKPLTLQP